MIRIRCRSCDRQWGIHDSEAGKPWQCPACGQEAVLPGTAPHEDVPKTALDRADTPAPPASEMAWVEEPDEKPYQITQSDLARAEALSRRRARRRLRQQP
jgi:hypothetical protein